MNLHPLLFLNSAIKPKFTRQVCEELFGTQAENTWKLWLSVGQNIESFYPNCKAVINAENKEKFDQWMLDRIRESLPENITIHIA